LKEKQLFLKEQLKAINEVKAIDDAAKAKEFLDKEGVVPKMFFESEDDAGYRLYEDIPENAGQRDILEYYAKVAEAGEKGYKKYEKWYNELIKEVSTAEDLVIGYDHFVNVLQGVSDGVESVSDSSDDTIPSIYDTAESFEELAKAADDATDSMRSAMDVSVSLLKAYKEKDSLTSSQIDQLKNAFPDSYMQALTIEGNLIKLNIETLKEMVIARARESLVASKTALSNIEAKRKEALSSISTARAIIESNSAVEISMSGLGLFYNKIAVEAVNSANNQIAAQQALLEGTEAQYKSLQDDIKLNSIYLSQLEDGSYWTNELADATSGDSDSLAESEKAYSDLLALTIKMLKQKKNAEKDALQDELAGYKKIIDARKRIIDLREEERDFQNDLDDKNEKLADIDAELLQLQFDNSEEAVARRLVLEDEKAKQIEDIDELQNDRSVEIQKDALDEEYDDYEELIDKKIALIDSYLSREGEIAQEAIAMMKNRTDGFYQSLLSWNRAYGDGIDSTISKLWAQVSAAHAASSISMNVQQVSTEPEKKPYIAPAKTQQDYYQDFQSGGLVWVEKGTGSRIVQSQYDMLPRYHEGGVVGMRGSKVGEVFANLMKGEVVVNQQQMSDFLGSTLPDIANSGITISMPITVQGNLDKSVLPELKSMIFDTIKKATDNRGIRRGVKSFSV